LQRALAAFRGVDLLLAPATPCAAPWAQSTSLELAGRTVPLRPSLGHLAQPFSCIGLPVVTVPVFPGGHSPIGVQIVAPPWREDLCLRAASHLDLQGVSASAADAAAA
jgi:Asp-tRNA(Asn)/Glu-tRNA(Gln) amidotransferase A subunit family amidase